jgi:hypothetical protein
MEGFKTLAKGVKCYKEGGSVYKSRHSEKREMSEDIAQDKKIIKKAFAMHDKQEHHGEKTDLSKLKKGGRAKKAQGTVKKYKAGGQVTNVYEAKKSSGDLDNIRKTKDIVPGKAAAPSRAAVAPIDNLSKQAAKPSGHKDPYIKSKESGKTAAAPSGAKGPDAYKKGGKIKKYAAGGFIDTVKAIGTDLKNNLMGTPEQNATAQANLDKQAAQGSKLAKFLGGKADAPSAPVGKCSGGKMKRGGKVC